MGTADQRELLEAVFSEARTANEIMSRDPLVVHADDAALDAAVTLVGREISGLPVVGDDMNLVGIITEKDVLKLLIEVAPDSENIRRFSSHLYALLGDEEAAPLGRPQL